MDGARLAYALGAEENDITWEDLGRYTDVLFIGGTKCGAMFGEAVTIIHEELKKILSTVSNSEEACLPKED